MGGNGTDGRIAGLPMAIAARTPQPSLVHSSPEPTFISQLIAEHQRLPPQRARYQVPLAQAVDAYASAARITIRRLPAGYRKTLVV